MKKKEKKIVIEISRNKVVKLIRDIKDEGVFFSLLTIKRTNGELRKFNCRGHVKKYLAGGTLKYNPASKGLIGIWDKDGFKKDKKGYRMINIKGIISMHFGGIEYRVK